STGSSAISAADWRCIRYLLKEVVYEVVNEIDNTKLNKLQNTIFYITTENQFLKAQNYGFKDALVKEKKIRKRSKA
ncbi:hypothetical protein M433DRAFT_74375, partial [Acidomyces richmondensis BFW]